MSKIIGFIYWNSKKFCFFDIEILLFFNDWYYCVFYFLNSESTSVILLAFCIKVEFVMFYESLNFRKRDIFFQHKKNSMKLLKNPILFLVNLFYFSMSEAFFDCIWLRFIFFMIYSLFMLEYSVFILFREP